MTEPLPAPALVVVPKFGPALKALWPHGDQHVPGLIEGLIASAPEVFQKYGITSNLVLAHLMGQFSEECGAGLEMIENDNFTAQGLMRTWPSRFTASMAQRYAHNPRAICDIAYGGRMGNRPPPSTDGYDFRGRGLSQTTGAEAYEKLGEMVGLELKIEPELINDPAHALECAVADFVKICGCLPYAQRDDIIGVTRHLNGGLIGLASRRIWTARWKHALGVA